VCLSNAHKCTDASAARLAVIWNSLQYMLHVAIVTNANLPACSQFKQYFGAEGWNLQVATEKKRSAQSNMKLTESFEGINIKHV
jgi:hypothetical protein